MTLQLANEHRQALSDLTDLMAADLGRGWTLASNKDARKVRDAMLEVVPPIAEHYGDMAGALGANYYEDAREVAGARGRFTAEPAPLPGSARYVALVRWGVDPLFRPVPDDAAALTLIEGGLQRVVSNVARHTVISASTRDPAAAGWQRTGVGECDWCNVLIGRGAVYREATADFAAHDHCRCGAVPAWGGSPVPVKSYTPSPRQSQADYDRAKKWVADHQ